MHVIEVLQYIDVVHKDNEGLNGTQQVGALKRGSHRVAYLNGFYEAKS